MNFYDIRNKFMYWLVKKLLTWGYPTWDQEYFMQLISDWSKKASKHFTKYSRHISADRSAKELLIVSEYADRLANNSAWDQCWNEETKEYEWSLEKIDKLEKEYLEAVLGRIRRKYRSWWY